MGMTCQTVTLTNFYLSLVLARAVQSTPHHMFTAAPLVCSIALTYPQGSLLADMRSGLAIAVNYEVVFRIDIQVKNSELLQPEDGQHYPSVAA